MSATTIRGSSPAQQIYSGSYPLSVRGVLIGFPNQGPLHTLGYWQSDNAVDIAVPVGTDVVAVTSGFVRARGDWGAPYNLASQTSGRSLLLLGDDGSGYFYSRLSQRLVTDGEHVVKGQVLGKSGGSNGVPHLHVAIQPQIANQVPNPSFERDTGGQAPASWLNGGHTTFQVQNTWASRGAQSLYAVTLPINSGFSCLATVDTGVTTSGLGQVFAVAAGQQVAVRADANIVAITGTIALVGRISFYNAAGANVGGGTAAVQPGTPGIVTFSDVYTAPATTALARVWWAPTSSGPASVMSYYLDAVLVAVGVTSVPPYNDDGDQSTNPQVRWG